MSPQFDGEAAAAVKQLREPRRVEMASGGACPETELLRANGDWWRLRSKVLSHANRNGNIGLSWISVWAVPVGRGPQRDGWKFHSSLRQRCVGVPYSGFRMEKLEENTRRRAKPARTMLQYLHAFFLPKRTVIHNCLSHLLQCNASWYM